MATLTQQEGQIIRGMKRDGFSKQDTAGAIRRFRETTTELNATPKDFSIGRPVSEFAEKHLKFQSEEDDLPTTSVLKFIGNLPGDTVQLGGDILQIAESPIDTMTSLGQVALGLSDKLVRESFRGITGNDIPESEYEQIVNAIGQQLKNEYGTIEKFKQGMIENPTDVLLTLAGGIGAVKNVAKARNLTKLAGTLGKVENAINPINLQAKALSTLGKTAETVKKGFFPKLSKNEAIGQIAQSKKPKDLATFGKGIEQIKGFAEAKTYDDLINATKASLDDIAKAQKAELGTSLQRFTPDQLAQAVKVGKKTVTTNWLDKAFTHLDELYKVGEDPVSRATNAANKTKAGRNGLTLQEVNDIAIQYGKEFGAKAFKQDGTPTTSVQGTAFENVRKGLKETVRGKLKTDTSKKLDKSYHEIADTQRQLKKVREGVQNLENKIIKRGWGQQLGGAIGTALDAITFGFAKGIGQKIFIESGKGGKTLDYLGIQEALNNNLKIIEQASKAKTSSKLEEILKRIVKPAQDSPGTIEILSEAEKAQQGVIEVQRNEILKAGELLQGGEINTDQFQQILDGEITLNDINNDI